MQRESHESSDIGQVRRSTKEVFEFDQRDDIIDRTEDTSTYCQYEARWHANCHIASLYDVDFARTIRRKKQWIYATDKTCFEATSIQRNLTVTACPLEPFSI